MCIRDRCIAHQMTTILRNFYEDDSVSKVCPGKKDFVLKNKIKKQRKILLDTKQNLYIKFIEETKAKMSYSTFSQDLPG